MQCLSFEGVWTVFLLIEIGFCMLLIVAGSLKKIEIGKLRMIWLGDQVKFFETEWMSGRQWCIQKNV